MLFHRLVFHWVQTLHNYFVLFGPRPKLRTPNAFLSRIFTASYGKSVEVALVSFSVE